MLKLLRVRDFRLLWLGGLISMTGDWALMAGVPYVVYLETGSTLATAGMVLAGLLPQILFSTTAGVFADRWDRRRLMILVNIALAIVLLPLLGVDTIGIWIVYAVIVAATVLEQLFTPAEVALLPQLVGEEHLVEANSLSSLNRNLSRLIGPGLGGIAVALAGLPGVVVIDAASFVASAALIALIPARASFKPTSAAAHHEAAAASALRRLITELRDGVAQATTSPLLMAVLAFTLITAIGEGVLGALFVPWVTDILHGDDLVYAAVLSTQAIGGLLGAVLVGRYLRNVAPARMLGVGAVLFGLIDLVLFTYPVISPIIWPALVGMVIVGVPATAIGVGFTTIQQTEVADSHRGRIVGLSLTLQAVGAFLGTSIGGLLGNSIGILPLIVIQGSGYAISGLIVLAVARRVRRSAAVPEHESSMAPAESL
ncbi:MAG TPA: MFS transporter [Candidatus Limnocylindrales bacterium]